MVSLIARCPPAAKLKLCIDAGPQHTLCMAGGHLPALILHGMRGINKIGLLGRHLADLYTECSERVVICRAELWRCIVQ